MTTTDTNGFPGHPLTAQSWSSWPAEGHPSEPVNTDEIPEPRRQPPPHPNGAKRPKGKLRPHPKYDTPGEMWAWHATRMAIFVSWTLAVTTSIIAGYTFVTIFVELIP